jgi:hypothetical protein
LDDIRGPTDPMAIGPREFVHTGRLHSHFAGTRARGTGDQSSKWTRRGLSSKFFCSAVELFSNAERAEDEVQDVVRGSGSGNLIEGPQGVVEIEKQHFVGDFVLHCDSRAFQRG